MKCLSNTSPNPNTEVVNEVLRHKGTLYFLYMIPCETCSKEDLILHLPGAYVFYVTPNDKLHAVQEFVHSNSVQEFSPSLSLESY